MAFERPPQGGLSFSFTSSRLTRFNPVRSRSVCFYLHVEPRTQTLSPKLAAIGSLGESQHHGAFDLRAQRDAGRVLRPPRRGRRRRDAPLLDPLDGLGGRDAIRAPDLRADGGR